MSRKIQVLGVQTGRGPNNQTPVRLELNDFLNDPDRKNLYLLGLESMMQKPQSDMKSWYQLCGIHGRPYTPWDGEAGTRGKEYGYCTHSSVRDPFHCYSVFFAHANGSAGLVLDLVCFPPDHVVFIMLRHHDCRHRPCMFISVFPGPRPRSNLNSVQTWPLLSRRWSRTFWRSWPSSQLGQRKTVSSRRLRFSGSREYLIQFNQKRKEKT
jgi:hypothetical protein